MNNNLVNYIVKKEYEESKKKEDREKATAIQVD
jgi:hypothetical protein